MVSFNVKINEAMHEIKDVDTNLCISDVKLMVENIAGVPRDSQKWIYKGRILTDQMTISESSIVDGNTIIVMKTAPAAQSVPVAAAAAAPVGTNHIASSGANYNQPIFRPNPTTTQFDNAMFELLQNPDESVILAAVTILLKVISNIIQSPSEEKYRRLNRTNAAFSKKVGSITGGSSCMMALGFQLVGDEWVLVPSAEAWEIITSCKFKLEKFGKRLSDQISSPNRTVPTSTSPTPAVVSTESVPGLGLGLPVPAPSTTVATDSPASPMTPLAMQQFLHSLAALQTSLPPQPVQSSQSSIAQGGVPVPVPVPVSGTSTDTHTNSNTSANTVISNSQEEVQGTEVTDENIEEEEEETIPQL